MKKKVYRQIRELANKVLGEEETNKIIEETIKETVEEFKNDIKLDKPKKKKETKGEK